jgi:hypothetical protein
VARTSEREERRFACSRCFSIVPESGIHVVPAFNDAVGEYVTSYRCEQCWLPSLDETAARIVETEDEAEIASLCAFLERHGIFVFEYRRGDPVTVVQKLLAQTIVLMKSGSIRLSAGKIAEIEDPAP